jgi:limonene-1,2-epoxide hydrolase
MGVAEENLVMEFLRHGEGRQIDVDAIAAMMTDDVVFQAKVPTRKERVGPPSRLAIWSEVLNMVSNDRFVFQERNTVFEMGDKRITLRLAAVFEVVDGKIAVWRE